MNRILAFLLISACLAPTPLSEPSTLECKVQVTAGSSDCIDTPVYVDLKLPAGSNIPATTNTSVRISTGDQSTAGQLERLESGMTRIWWVVSKISAGETVEYSIDMKTPAAQNTASSFQWQATDTDKVTSTTLNFGKRPVLRYMHTQFSADNIELTKKPYHHLYAPDGSQLITKGHEGLYPHHRGIYFGYNKCQVNGKSYDIWHAHKGEHQTHIKEVHRFEGPVFGGHTVRIDWNDRDGKTFAKETRRVTVFQQSNGHQLVDFQTHLEVTDGPVKLRGDPQHAGVQFRAAQFVANNQKLTRYLRPAKWKDLPETKQINFPGNKQHKDMPWNAVRFMVQKSPYTVAYLSHPSNPNKAQSSERLYGRFGEYFPYDLSEGHPLDVTYRWWVSDNHDVDRSSVEARYQAMAVPPTVQQIQ
jgi:hypothetical protein